MAGLAWGDLRRGPAGCPARRLRRHAGDGRPRRDQAHGRRAGTTRDRGGHGPPPSPRGGSDGAGPAAPAPRDRIARPAAIRFYERSGFAARPPFGQYTADPLSLFFEKTLLLVAFDAVGATDEADLVELSSAFHAGEGRSLDERSRAALAVVCAGEPLARAWLIGLEGRLAGYVLVTLGFGIEYGGRDVFLDELYLVPEARGRGLGAAAMAFVERQARAQDAVAIHLVVTPDNRRAQQLYARSACEDAGWRLTSRPL